MNLSNDRAKIEIVSRLVKEGAIDFTEATKLLELEQEFVTVPVSYPSTGPWPHDPWQITFESKTNTPVVKDAVTTSVVRTIGDDLITFTNSHLQ